ncbi:PAS domain S-box protein [Piscinibacter aquaticus]|uniref:histidine kinase n=1 Tax=Piscinibacter aquaticus TaxID=392597 RepID=A0A5C6TZ67_9BURK|nr:PAS domain S-box protein [Piscinibacter aquaticus]
MVTVFNRGAQRLLGHDPDDVIGRMRALDFHDGEEMKMRAGTLAARCGRPVAPREAVLAEESLGREQEWTFRRRDGSTVPVSLVVTAMRDDAGALVGYLSLAQDVSARREYERSLKQAMHRANHANRAKSQFLANMSHEIRTPLNAVIGLSYLLERTALDADQSGFVGKIKVASKSLLSIINDVLDLSKIEAAEMQIERAPFAPLPMLTEIAELMRVQAEAKGIGFAMETPDPLPDAVEGDVTRLRR